MKLNNFPTFGHWEPYSTINVDQKIGFVINPGSKLYWKYNFPSLIL